MYIDVDYIKWMKLNHPEVDILIPSEQDSGSLLDSFPDIIPMSPTLIEYPEQERIDEAVSVHDNQLLPIPGASSSGPQLLITSEKKLPTNSEQQLQEQLTAGTSPTLVNNQGTMAQNIMTTTSKNSNPPLREFLIYPATNPITSTTSSLPKRAVPKARLLTSDESLAMLEEKEKAKKDALLEKERRKAERIAKKQQ